MEALLQAQKYVFAPEPFSPICRRLLEEPQPLGASLAAFFGYIYIQDRSSMLPPLALGPSPGMAVLDMCASPGSKTGFLAQLVGECGFVLANEPSTARLATLNDNLQRLNLLHVSTCSYRGETLPLPPASWDAIVLDPPCSGWGTSEKHPRVLRLWRGDKIETLTLLQQRLLRQAVRLLRPGGQLVYSTCTTTVEENEGQVRFAEENLGLVRVPLKPFPGFVWEQRPDGAGTLRVDGPRSAAQGFFLALLRKPMDAAEPSPAADALPDALQRHAVPSWDRLLSGNLNASLCDVTRLPPGQIALVGKHVRFLPQRAREVLPDGFRWQGALLGTRTGDTWIPAPRLRVLLPAADEGQPRLELDDLADVLALCHGQSRQTGLPGRSAGLWWRGLPLACIRLKQGRALLGCR